jgi:hypothetical protein
MFLFTKEKNKDECAEYIKVFKDNIKVLDTFVNYGINEYDFTQSKNYWFSCLTYKHFNVKELRLSYRTKHIINYEFCTSVNYLKMIIKNINDFINNNLQNLCEFVESDKTLAYYDNIE